MKNHQNQYRALALALTVAAMIFGSVPAVFGLSDTGLSSGDESPPAVSPDVDMANVEVVATLDPFGKCLFSLGVYPTPAPNGALAVDDFRGEVLRFNV